LVRRIQQFQQKKLHILKILLNFFLNTKQLFGIFSKKFILSVKKMDGHSNKKHEKNYLYKSLNDFPEGKN